MTKKVNPIPAGHRSLTPHLIVKGAAKAIEFYKKAFGAVELMRVPNADGTIMHAQIRIGDSIAMIADHCPQMGPLAEAGTQGQFLFHFTPEVDAVVKAAQAAGAKVEMPVQDMFWGDRAASLMDPFGHRWWVATHIEDLTPEQMAERHKKAFANAK
jgi:uncharacterized glyoxalase superfamily protein PhnB